MANLNALAQEVAALNKVESDDFAFIDALDHIEEAGETTGAEIDTLRDILSHYRSKLPNRETLDLERVRAKDLASTLMLSTLAERIDRIRTRNDVLSSLTSELDTQIDKANADASRLKQIKDAVDRATKTVNEVKALINQLTSTEVSVRDKLTGLVESLGNISTIFAPS